MVEGVAIQQSATAVDYIMFSSHNQLQCTDTCPIAFDQIQSRNRALIFDIEDIFSGDTLHLFADYLG